MYKLFLFIHVFAAIAMLGPVFLLPALMRMRGDPPSVTVLRVEHLIGKYATGFTVVALATGAGLMSTSPLLEDRIGEAVWLHIAVTLFLIVAGLGTGFVNPRMRKAVKAAETGDAAEVRRFMDPVDKVVGPALSVLVAVILYLMLFKPDF
ncbi:MAG: hypothetical protein AB1679_05145 [Actinomycetota bacterium]